MAADFEVEKGCTEEGLLYLVAMTGFEMMKISEGEGRNRGNKTHCSGCCGKKYDGNCGYDAHDCTILCTGDGSVVRECGVTLGDAAIDLRCVSTQFLIRSSGTRCVKLS